MANDSFQGSWSALSDSCNGNGIGIYTPYIVRNSNTEFRIQNYIFAPHPIICTLSGNNFNIARQNPGGGTDFIVGSGIINASFTQIYITYTYTDERDPQNILTFNCSGYWIKL